MKQDRNDQLHLVYVKNYAALKQKVLIHTKKVFNNSWYNENHFQIKKRFYIFCLNVISPCCDLGKTKGIV